MLGTRTKQIFSYGKRSHRIINVEDEEEFTSARSRETRKSDTTGIGAHPVARPGRENMVSMGASPKAIKGMRKVSSPSSVRASPAFAMKPNRAAASVRPEKKQRPRVYIELTASSRRPLAPFSTNSQIPPSTDSPVLAKKSAFTGMLPPTPVLVVDSPERPAGAKSKLTPKGKKSKRSRASRPKPSPPNATKTSRPVVDVDIVVLGESGRRVSQEHRVVHADVQVNPRTTERPVKRSLRGDGSAAKPILLSDSEESPIIKKAKGGKRKAQVIPSSDESSEDSDIEVLSKPPPNARLAPPSFGNASSISKLVRQNESAAHTAAGPSTPVRSQALPGSTGTNVVTPSDMDELEDEFAELDLSPSVLKELAQQLATEQAELRAKQPAWLLPLLNECSQNSPHDFSSFITTFPYDPVVYPDDESASRDPVRPVFKKIGEASYSEVFGIGDVVLKVIPLEDELAISSGQVDPNLETPAPSNAKDVLREIIVTRTIGDMCASPQHEGKLTSCGAFVKLLRAYVVKGRYPSLLLDLWDQFNGERGSENVRPDGFQVSQMYAIIVLPNGGPDLEAYTFERSAKSGWKQAASLFWQVARTLSRAEELVRFEHRDLHWGQILVKNIAPVNLERLPLGARNGRGKVTKAPMDHPSHGVKATIIDLGLARMDAGDQDSSDPYWTPFDEEIFQGEGDYQFDVYRMMREHNGDHWEEFRPLTNVMWLHYVVTKLLKSKQIRPPVIRKNGPVQTSSTTFTEKECYDCLIDMERVLSAHLPNCTTKQKLGKKIGGSKASQSKVVPASQGQGPNSARDVLEIGVIRGWVHAAS